MSLYLEQSLAQLEIFEGSIPWMYVDTVGKVTTGVGTMLADAEAAARLPFHVNGVALTPAEIAEAFRRVEALPMGRPALFYRYAGAPELDQTAIGALLQETLVGFEADLRKRLSDYDSFPDQVKLALLDMAYNLGPEGLLKGYPRLLKAVEAKSWAAAAAASFRHGPGAARNQWTRAMFLEQVVPAIKAEAQPVVNVMKQLGFGLVGLTATIWTKLRTKPTPR